MTKTDKSIPAWGAVGVWLTRIIVGITFIISGWAKSVDPWGFIYKIEEYLLVWGVDLPREFTLTAAVGISACEFIIGMLIITGSMRKVSVWLCTLFMAAMLPLTAYIYIADPVADCGCFGDLLILSNGATLAKNVALTLLIIVLLLFNDRVKGIYVYETQSLVAVGAGLYALILVAIGYRIQPVVDFRPYHTGSPLLTEDTGDAEFVYEKDGVRQTFTLESLPDDDWTFVEAISNDDRSADRTLAIYDGDEDVTDEVLADADECLIFAVVDLGIHNLTRARLANMMSDKIAERGGRMIALVAAQGEALDDWKQLALPSYEVYSAEDTSLKELVRGDAGIVYVSGGNIVWKRNLASIRHDLFDDEEDADRFFSDEPAVDDGKQALWLSIVLGAWLIVIYIFNLPAYIKRRLAKKSYLCKENNENKNHK